MSKRRELVRHIDSLTDIGELLGAMRSLAQAESRRIATFIDAQRSTAAIVRGAFARLRADFGAQLPAPPTRGRLICVVGSERGFCGDLNQQLAADACALPGCRDTDTQWVLVGARLIDAWPADAPAPVARLAGAGIADDVLPVQAALIAALTPHLLAATDAMPALHLHALGEAGIVHTPLLPLDDLTQAAPAASHPVDVTLPLARLHASLLDQYLDIALSGALLDALLHENEQRLAHMEQARRNVDEKLDELSRRANRARQEEITEEIEIILLAGEADASRTATAD
jgi:F-type H+-transporting ATPase subunit gamma